MRQLFDSDALQMIRRIDVTTQLIRSPREKRIGLIFTDPVAGCSHFLWRCVMSVPLSFLASLATPAPTSSTANSVMPYVLNPKPGDEKIPDTASGSWGSTAPGSAVRIACGGALKPGAGYLELEKSKPGETVDQQVAGYAKTLKGKPLQELAVYPVVDDKVPPPRDQIFTTGSRTSGYGMKGGDGYPIGKLVDAVMKNNVLQKGGTLGIAAESGHVTKALLTQLAKTHHITIAVYSAGPGIDFYLPNGEVKTDPDQVFGQLNTRGGCGPGLQPAEKN
jgi:hypothetical protein